MSAQRPIGPIARLVFAGTLIGATLSMQGCVGLAVTGVAVGTMVAIDRRTVGAQTEDTSIELKAAQDLSRELPAGSSTSVTSYNRKVLITGQVPDEQAKRTADAVVARITNVRSVHNELKVGAKVSASTTANDAGITTKVKAAFVEAKDLQTNSLKVVTEDGVVYLMGVVTRAEGDRAAQVASRVSGVKRVVTVFEYVTPDELARIIRTNEQSQSSGQAQPK
jgi:osmotically-inducible protein OsmY